MRTLLRLSLVCGVAAAWVGFAAAAVRAPLDTDAAGTPTAISGRVLDPSGKPAVGITVSWSTPGMGFADWITSSTETDSSGGFRFDIGGFTTPAPYSVLCASSLSAVSVCSLAGLHSAAGTMTMHGLTALRVRAVDDSGAPLAHVTLLPVYLKSGPEFIDWNNAISQRWTVQTNASGVATLYGLPQGDKVLLGVDDPRYVVPDFRGEVDLAKSTDAGVHVLTFTRGGSISGTVTFGGGFPAPALEVCATGYAGASGYASVDQQGRYTISRLTPGIYSVYVERGPSQDWTAPAKAATVAAAGTTTVDIALIRGATIAGTVTYRETGAPAAGVLLFVPNAPGAGVARTDKNGRYSLVVPPGSVTIMVEQTRNDAQDTVKAVRGETVTANFALAASDLPGEPVAVSGVVLRPDGRPAAGATVIASTVYSGNASTTTDAVGRFTFAASSALTTHSVLLAKDGALATPRPVPAAGHVLLHLTQGAEATLRGQVLLADGRPARDISVSLVMMGPQQLGGSEVATTRTDGAGNYSFPSQFRDETYGIESINAGYTDGQTFYPPLRPKGAVLHIQPIRIAIADSFVGGVVLSQSGAPLAYAQVKATAIDSAITSADAHGRFRLNGVTRGHVLLQIYAPDVHIHSIDAPSGRLDDVIRTKSESAFQASLQQISAGMRADPFHGDGDSALHLLRLAELRAASEHKAVLLTFGSTWCGGCYELDQALRDPQIAPIVDAHFVVQPIDIWEGGRFAGKKGWANPGGQALYKHYAGKVEGVPFYTLLDSAGKQIGNSMRNGDNTGCPISDENIAHFLANLKRAAPMLTHAELMAVRTAFERDCAA